MHGALRLRVGALEAWRSRFVHCERHLLDYPDTQGTAQTEDDDAAGLLSNFEEDRV